MRVVVSPDPEAEGRSIDLARPLTFGRGAAGLGLIRDPMMSREHARVAPVADGLLVEDLSASNGTFLNGARVREAAFLEPQAVLRLGDTFLVLDEEPPRDALPANAAVSSADVPELVGSSFAAVQLRRSIATVAPTAGAVLLLGPTGTGKDVSAKAIHRLSGRPGPFVAVNCAAIPSELAEAELFGHRRGAFTGAMDERAGLFVDASGGTLFLDELGDLSPPIQAKLLRVIEDGQVQALGGGAPRSVDVRLIGATSLDLDAKGFRRDLAARLGDWTLHVPALADRRADVVSLWRAFSRCPLTPSGDFMEALLVYDWPLNVRELLKLARRVDALARGEPELSLDLLPDRMRSSLDERAIEEERAEHRRADPIPPPPRAELEEALREAAGNLTQVASSRGWHRTQVYRWAKKYQLDLAQFRGPDPLDEGGSR